MRQSLVTTMPYSARSILVLDATPFSQSINLITVCKSLRAAYPETLLVAAAAAGTCQLLTASGVVNEVIDLGVIGHADGRALKRFAVLARRSRRYGFDLVLDFSPRLETEIVSRVLVRARTLTPARLPRPLEFLLNLGGSHRTGEHRRFDDYELVLRQAGVEISDAEFHVTPAVQENERFERFLSQGGSRGGELLVLLYRSDPGSARGWPIESFGEVSSRLVNNLGARAIAADEPSDRRFSEAVSRFLPHGSLKLSSPSAPALVAAIARSSIVVTDDHGIAELATELRTPVIEVSDSGSATIPDSRTHRVITGSSRARVSTDEVYEAAAELLQESRSASIFDRP